MALGWLVTVVANGLVYYTIAFTSAGRPSVSFLSLMTFIMGCGLWFADVMADSLVAEKARHEPLASRGTLQSNCCKYSQTRKSSPGPGRAPKYVTPIYRQGTPPPGWRLCGRRLSF